MGKAGPGFDKERKKEIMMMFLAKRDYALFPYS